jgi:hypothetical protein
MNWLRGCLYFLVPVVVFAQQDFSADKQLAVLEGTVVHSVTQAPVRKARVALERLGEAREPVLAASTDDAGHFRFRDIKAGRYTLTAQKSGFLDGAYGAVKAEDSQSVLNVSAGDQMPDLVIQMFPASMISGQVLDADGDSMAAIDVQLWSQRRVHGKLTTSLSGSTNTNEAGEYHLGQLSPGTYYVSAYTTELQYATRQISVDKTGKATNLHEFTTFYPSSLSMGNAQKIHLENGQNQSGINIFMQRGLTHSVKGKIAATNDASKYKMFAYSPDGTGLSKDTVKLLPNGDFEFGELPPGRYILGIRNRGADDQILGKTEVNVTDQDVTGVVITPFNPAQVRVRIRMEGEDEPITSGSVLLNPVSDSDFRVSLFEHATNDGLYKMQNVVPGKYRIWFNLEKDCYLKTMLSGEQELNPDSVEIGDGVTTNILAIFSKNVATLGGDVEISSEEAKKSVQVLLIPEERSAGPSGLFSAPVDQLFHFSAVQLPPGKYLAFAAEDFNEEAWTDPEFLKLIRSEGTKVELQEKEQKTIRLPLLKKSKTDQARKQLGII